MLPIWTVLVSMAVVTATGNDLDAGRPHMHPRRPDKSGLGRDDDTAAQQDYGSKQGCSKNFHRSSPSGVLPE